MVVKVGCLQRQTKRQRRLKRTRRPGARVSLDQEMECPSKPKKKKHQQEIANGCLLQAWREKEGGAAFGQR